MRLREIIQMMNGECPPLLEAAIPVPEVSNALADFARLAKGLDWAVCGGVAASFHTKPRSTMDVDVLVPNDQEIAKLAKATESKFNLTRPHCLEHIKSGVEIELLTPMYIGKPIEIIRKAIDNAGEHPIAKATARVLTPLWTAILKLDRFHKMDQWDIEQIERIHGPLDIESQDIPKGWKLNWRKLKQEIEDSKKPNE